MSAPETYRDLIRRLADDRTRHYERVRDLPELSHADLAAIARHFPGIFLDAMCEHDRQLRALVPETLEQAGTPVDRYRLLGLHLVAALRGYVLPLVLVDTQREIERRRQLDAIERDTGRREFLTADQLTAFELGLARTLQ
jgi:hypothetical protein